MREDACTRCLDVKIVDFLKKQLSLRSDIPKMKTLYLFNPENDMALACGDPYYMAPANVRRMAAELSALPAWYADEGGEVLLDSSQRAEVLKSQCPLSLPVRWVTEVSFIYNKVCPWGWSPSLVRRLGEAGINADACPSRDRMERIRRLSGRQTAVQLLPRLRGVPSAHLCCDGSSQIKNSLSESEFPVSLFTSTVGESFILHSVEEVEKFVVAQPAALLKAPWSGSGRGIQYTSGDFPAPLKGWVEHILITQNEVVGEPCYDKLLDFAMEFLAESDGNIRFLGYSLFETDKRGSYKENMLAADADLESRLTDYVPVEVLHGIREKLVAELAIVIKGDYQGYLGVDMIICRIAEAGKESYALHPCVEINLRMNMGVVARLIYDRYVCQGTYGRYVIEYYRTPGEAEQTHQNLCRQYPLVIENGKVKSGYLSLTPVDESTAYQAYIIMD